MVVKPLFNIFAYKGKIIFWGQNDVPLAYTN